VNTDLAQPLIGFGQVRHTRLRPTQHAFAYPTYFLMLPLRSMQAQLNRTNLDSKQSIPELPKAPEFSNQKYWGIGLNRFGALGFHDCDHGDGRGPEQGGALAWLDAVLAREGVTDADGEAWLHCYPRVWGFTFKPVSFWYCHRRDGSLRAILVEVNNTFGQRHCYVLDAPSYGIEQVATKVFYVSPFCAVQGEYRFRFMRTAGTPAGRTVVRIDYGDADGPLLQTSVSGELVPLTPASVRRALWHYPAMTWGVVARIHWQAVKLWCKRVPYFAKPVPPVPATPLGSVSR
jgi:uncharacterized protein